VRSEVDRKTIASGGRRRSGFTPLTARVRRLRSTAAVIAVAATQACSAFQPVPVTEVSPGREIRVELTPDGAVRLGGSIGARARYLLGRAEGAGPEGLLLAVSTLVRDDGNEQTLDGTPVAIPPQEIVRVESRRLDRPRTVVAALALVAGTFVASRAVSGGTSGGGGGGGGNSGQQ
jgi:hypothetical protein